MTPTGGLQPIRRIRAPRTTNNTSEDADTVYGRDAESMAFSRFGSASIPGIVTSTDPTLEGSTSRARTQACALCENSREACDCTEALTATQFVPMLPRAVPVVALPPTVAETVVDAMRLFEDPTTPQKTRQVLEQLFWAMNSMAERCDTGGDTKADDTWKSIACLSASAVADARGAVPGFVAAPTVTPLFKWSSSGTATIDIASTMARIFGREFMATTAGYWIATMTWSGMLWRLLRALDGQGFRVAFGPTTTFCGPTRTVVDTRPVASKARSSVSDGEATDDDDEDDTRFASDVDDDRTNRVAVSTVTESSGVGATIEHAERGVGPIPSNSIHTHIGRTVVAPPRAVSIAGLTGIHGKPLFGEDSDDEPGDGGKGHTGTDEGSSSDDEGPASRGPTVAPAGPQTTAAPTRFTLAPPPAIGIPRTADNTIDAGVFKYPMTGYVLHAHNKTTEAPFSPVCVNHPTERPSGSRPTPSSDEAASLFQQIRRAFIGTARPVSRAETDVAIASTVMNALPGIVNRFGTHFPVKPPSAGVQTAGVDVAWTLTMGVPSPRMYTDVFNVSNPALCVMEGVFVFNISQEGDQRGFAKPSDEELDAALSSAVRSALKTGGLQPGMTFQIVRHDAAPYLIAMYHMTAIQYAERLRQWEADCRAGVSHTVTLTQANAASVERLTATKQAASRLAATLTQRQHRGTLAISQETECTWNTVQEVETIANWREYRLFNMCYDLEAIKATPSEHTMLFYGRTYGWRRVKNADIQDTDTGGPHNTTVLRAVPVIGPAIPAVISRSSHGISMRIAGDLKVFALSDVARGLSRTARLQLVQKDPMFAKRGRGMHSAFVSDPDAFVAVSHLVVIL